MSLPTFLNFGGRSRPRLHGIAITTALIILLLGWLTHRATSTPMTATVDYAPNGDTLELLFELNAAVPATKIRLAGVQAPSLEQAPWGAAARECLSDLRNEVITIETTDWTVDRYGRVWADAWHGQEWLNRRVLAQGCGYLSRDRAPTPQYAQLVYAQEAARLLGLGIWNPQQPLRKPA